MKHVKTIPILPTLMVLAAALAMAGLGVRQLRQQARTQALAMLWTRARALPPVAWPAVPPAGDGLLYRRTEGFCLAVTGFGARAGEDRGGQAGWHHLAACRTGAEGPGMLVDIGWSRTPDMPSRWIGGKVSGVIGPDPAHRILLVADQAAPGLAPSPPPDPGRTPGGGRVPALLWFAGSGLALLCYGVALIGYWRRAGRTR